ncbi:PREDICTED: 50S ribosomal protein L28-like isoform X2 [Acropora digitifera]|uniref:50S ribosomal protein L28-like n=1 Tax=Acropora millepora TaxID=45264 RepID=UPI00077AD0A9|nr:PREDICTED: 50S ribosomal protein L28-like isoform X2 [Acropora digitifera]XP_029192126.2 50S ribosomal protein L28-like [Acropora millepora]
MVLLSLRFTLFKNFPKRAKTFPEQVHQGIFHGKGYMYGHETTFSGKKTKRVWKPNVVRKTYYSEVLEQKMRFQFSTHALRCIDKAGGFDNYIINTKEKWLHSRTAIELKRLMFEVLKCKEQGMPMSQIKKEVFPKPKVSRHVYIPRTYDTRFYFDWKGPRKQVIFC